MANIPWVEALHLPGKTYLIIVTSTTVYDDGFRGNRWVAYDTDGKLVGYGFSKGSRKYEGMGSALMAMRNAKRSLRARYERESRKIYLDSLRSKS